METIRDAKYGDIEYVWERYFSFIDMCYFNDAYHPAFYTIKIFIIESELTEAK